MVHSFGHTHGVCATYLRTEGMLQLVIAASYTLNERDAVRGRFVRGTEDLPFLPEHVFELESSNHVSVNPVTVAGPVHRIESLKTTCHHDCVGLTGSLFPNLVQANRVLRALVLADPATLILEIQTTTFINGI